MNNDLRNNHSSMSSNKYIANNRPQGDNRLYKESYIKDKNKAMFDIQSKGNKTIFFDSDNDKKSSNQKELLISKAVSRYPTNYAPGPDPYNSDIVKGYFIDRRQGYNPVYQIPLNENQEEEDENDERNIYYDQNQQNIKNGGDEIEDEDGNVGEDEEEMEIENGNENQYNNNYNNYIGDGIVRNNIPNYSPYQNQNGQNILYFRKKNLYNRNYSQENENQNENIEGPYIIESPAQQYININSNMQPYNRKRILGNLGDSASSEVYAKNYNNQISPSYTDNSSKIYVKPKTKYNNVKNGISTEERGIESNQEITNNVANNGANLRRPFNYMDNEEKELKIYNKINNYDEDSINVVEPPIYNIPNNDINKGGKVDLNNFRIIKKKGKRTEDEYEGNDEEKIIEEEYNIDEDKLKQIIKLQKYLKNHIQVTEIKVTKIIKIQSVWRGRSTRKIIKLYQDLDEFIFLLSKVHFNHFSDNFYYFINQLFNVYKANTLDDNQLNSLDEEKEEENQNDSNEEEEKLDENNPNNKNYEELLNDYKDLQRRYNNLVNNKDKFDKSATKKSLLNNNNDIISVPGETTLGTIKTDNNKLKFKHQNNSTNNINNENITFSNDYNDEVEVNNKEYERRFYTPNPEDEDSFNDNSKDKRFSYSSIHSEENSRYFDNEQPKGNSNKRNLLKNKAKISKIGLNKRKEKPLSYTYSPSFENDKHSRENSKTKNINNESQNENKMYNISVIIPKHEEEFGIIKSNIDDKNDKSNANIEEMEGKIYDKYINNFSKNLLIIKNNKINLKNQDEMKEKLNYFDNENIYPENENTIELRAHKKSDEQKLKDIFDNEKFLKKIKNKISENLPEKKLSNEVSFIIENKNPANILEKINNEIQQNINNLEIIQNNHRNFHHSKLDFESNELSLLDNQLSRKKKLKKIIPIFEKEIIIEKMPDKLQIFSEGKTLPTFNLNEEKNTFTIYNNMPKMEQKPTSFNIEKMIIDNVFKNELKMEEPNINENNEDLNQKEIDKVKDKDLVYIPFKDNKFKRLRRSKRTKETYFTIKPDLTKIDNELKEDKDKDKDKEINIKNDAKIELKKINENNFLIKNEYYYIESKDNQIPQIIEKKIKETVVVNKPSNDFNNSEMILSNQNNFNIQGDKMKKKYFEDIEKNELIILSEDKNKSGKKHINLRNNKNSSKKIINKNEEFTINSEQKKWVDLNPIANDEFWFRNEIDYDNKGNEEENEGYYESNNIYANDNKGNEEENEGYYENNNIYANDNKGNEEENGGYYENNNIYSNDNMNIETLEPFEIIDKNEDINKDKSFIEAKQNIINIDGIEKNTEDKESQINIRQVNITTKKIVKQEKILSRRKFLNNKISLESSFSLYGTNNKNIKYIIKDVDKDNINTKDNSKKEIILLKENVIELNYKQIKKNTKEIETETEPINEINEFSVILPINNNEFIIKGRKIKTKERETEISDEFDKNIYDKDNDNNNEIDNIQSNKEIILENIKNENIMLKGNKKKMKESETETELDNEFYNIKSYYNNELINQNNENIEIIPEKELKDNIKENDKKEIMLEKSKIDEINLESRIRAFPKLDINNSLNETFNKKEKEKIDFEKINNESIMLESNKEKEEFKDKNKDKEYIIENNQISIISSLDKIEISNKNEVNLKPFEGIDINKSEEYNIKGEEKEIQNKIKKKKMKEMETQMDDDDLINICDIPESYNEINEEPNQEKSNRFRGRKGDKDIIPNKQIITDEKEESQKNDNIRSDSPEIKQKKNRTSEKATEIDNELISNFAFNNNEVFTYESIKPEKKENIIVKNDNINIYETENQNKKDLNLIIEEQQPLNIYDDINKNLSKKEFNQDEIIISDAEAFILNKKEENQIISEPQISENENPKLNTKTLNNLEHSIEKRIEIIGNASNSNIDKNNTTDEKNDPKVYDEENLIENFKDLDPSTTKEIINNIVQDKLEKEKQKNMDQTKNKLMQVVRVIKLKNALSKNLYNKKYFIEKLKNLSTVNQKNKYPELNIQKKDDIEIITYEKDDQKINDNIKTKLIDRLNNLEKVKNDEFSIILSEKVKKVKKSKKTKKHKKNLSTPINPIEYTEVKPNKDTDLDKNDLNENKDEKDIEDEPIKELKITTNKIIKEISSNFLELESNVTDSFTIKNQKINDTCTVATQTPKLRPKKQDAQKVVFHEIKTIIKKEQKPANKYELSHECNLKLISNIRK